MEGKIILSQRNILFAGNSAWADPTEQQIMFEMLSTANKVIWANPFGPLVGALLPRITNPKEGLTIYNPGVNLLPLDFLRGLNEKRRLMQLNMYLLEIDFEPDLVWIDNPNAGRFTEYYAKKGALTLYYALDELDKTGSREERAKVVSAIDMIMTPSPVLYRKYREQTEKTFLLSGGDLTLPEETEDDQLADEELEKAFMDALQARLNEISVIIEKE